MSSNSRDVEAELFGDTLLKMKIETPTKENMQDIAKQNCKHVVWDLHKYDKNGVAQPYEFLLQTSNFITTIVSL